MKIAIIKNNINSFEKYVSKQLRQELQNNPYGKLEIYDLYKAGIISRIVVLLAHQKLDFWGLEKFCYGNWKNKVQDYDVVIVFDNGISCDDIFLLRNNNINARMIFWNWNTGLDTKREDLLRKLNYEIWGFDPYECEKRKFNYNSQFYFVNLKQKNGKEQKIKYDLLFVGADKGREKQVLEMLEWCERNKLTYYIKIKTMNVKKILNMPQLYSARGVSYTKLLHKIKQSGCILDLVKDGQKGLTIRALEGLFWGKKLITNMDYEPFSGFENKYVLYKENIKSEKDFVYFLKKDLDVKEYQGISEYLPSAWFARFFEK